MVRKATEMACCCSSRRRMHLGEALWSSLLVLLICFSQVSGTDATKGSRRHHQLDGVTVPTRTRRRGHPRSLVMFGTMEGWIQRQQQQRQRDTVLLASSNTAPIVEYKPPPFEDDDDHNTVVGEEKETCVEDVPPSETTSSDITQSMPMTPATLGNSNGNHRTKKRRREGSNKLWPPWPFNLLQRSSRTVSSSDIDEIQQYRGQGPVVRMGSVMFSFFGQRARVSFKELQCVGSRLWFHLPPMTPPLILLTLLPRQEAQVITSAETGVQAVVQRTVVPLWSNPLARYLVLTGFSFAIMSWAHSELNRLRRLTPLPLNYAYRDIHSAVLPHALPEEVPEPYLVVEDDDEEEETADNTNHDDTNSLDLLASTDASNDSDTNSTTTTAHASSTISQKLVASVPPRLQRHLHQLGLGGTADDDDDDDESSSSSRQKPKRRLLGTNWRKNMKHMRDVRRAESQKVKRMAIYDELVALQAIKRKAISNKPQRKHAKVADPNDSEEPLGYALVTGASRGIGRAIAVELARWEIPLILVARDLPRLTSLAYDLEACYGIKCCVLQADLAEPNAAQQIHQATKDANLTIDILVNNAGISSQGLAVDMALQDVERMMRVNGLAVANLAHLYGKDMKERRRGRILMVSSVVGAVAAGPTVAMYAATKAFEKTLGLSLAKELELFGVGVTCLMPGAVKDTDFRSTSSTHEALCWKLPGYPKTAATVAQLGVTALLTGDVEVTPGWQNRAFLKVFQPAMPSRLHNILVEIAWNEPYIPPFLKFWKNAEKRQNDRQRRLEERSKHHVEDDTGTSSLRKASPQEWRPRSNTFLPPPLLLTVPGEQEAASSPPVPSKSEQEVDRPETNHDSVEEPSSSLELDEPEAQISTEEVHQQEAEDDNSQDDPYGHLRELSAELENAPSTVHNSTVDNTPNQSEQSDSTAPSTDGSPQQEQQSQPTTERSLLQLQEQVMKLQQQVQTQEREQFLQQIELERRQREIEFEKRDMERERERQESESQNQDNERRKSTSWQKRQAKRADVQPRDMTKNSRDKPERRNPQPAEQSQRLDLMTESLEHPLFAP
ncbi:Testosterone 17-beta-dehydrogenase 3 [Seminavis robusta]|uniref:Testosterone 17-beta-dehydrogenase 3 n=1 Tax=Seminavis robusta TaxID=568900 RepID=A0A9N8DHA4_9STRA|nr:Testosterone 17-beta-dehydrogenase 3 [Seminavis robusta]|eukprot:Sro120_g058640.1 Testosterone 17-beta-dehydrogenase 3 (1066) ;mRNA; r:89602-93031